VSARHFTVDVTLSVRHWTVFVEVPSFSTPLAPVFSSSLGKIIIGPLSCIFLFLSILLFHPSFNSRCDNLFLARLRESARVFRISRETGPVKTTSRFPSSCYLNGSAFNLGASSPGDEVVLASIKTCHEGLIPGVVRFVERLEGPHQLLDEIGTFNYSGELEMHSAQARDFSGESRIIETLDSLVDNKVESRIFDEVIKIMIINGAVGNRIRRPQKNFARIGWASHACSTDLKGLA